MEIISFLIDFVLHIDQHLAELVNQFGGWTYVILFLIIFLETGLVVTPFLPGDSLLFATGALCAVSNLDVHTCAAIMLVAAIIGDACNYAIGHYIGLKLVGRTRFFNKQHFDQAYAFYEKHGGKTIILARFIPIIRTFAPFVGGVAKMRYSHFLSYNVIGAFAWVLSFLYLGYFFGNMPIIKKNFSLVVLGIIVVSVLPAVYEFVKAKYRKA